MMGVPKHGGGGHGALQREMTTLPRSNLSQRRSLPACEAGMQPFPTSHRVSQSRKTCKSRNHKSLTCPTPSGDLFDRSTPRSSGESSDTTPDDTTPFDAEPDDDCDDHASRREPTTPPSRLPITQQPRRLCLETIEAKGHDESWRQSWSTFLYRGKAPKGRIVIAD
eukprot:m.138891 g.138891  ORF g.138891 m.138891 type:complete len:166 (+) comp22740_c0_seq1:505-1002(+)